MTTVASGREEVDREALEAWLGTLRGLLEARATMNADDGSLGGEAPTWPALDRLAGAFELSSFERWVLLLSCGAELDDHLGSLCAALSGGERSQPTFGLALAALPDAHWSATTADRPLRRWQLVQPAGDGPLVHRPLRIAEPVLHHLLGVVVTDSELCGMLTPYEAAADLPGSMGALARSVLTWWADRPATVVELVGRSGAAALAVAAGAADALGLRLQVLDVGQLPREPQQLDGLARLLERHMVLASSALVIDATDADETHLVPLRTLLAALSGPVVLAAREQLPLSTRDVVPLDVAKPTAGEQRDLWSAAGVPDATAAMLAGQFDLVPDTIRAVSTAAPPGDRDHLWAGCRSRVRSRMGALAQRLEPAVTWDQLVLGGPQRDLLDQVVAHVQHRLTVYDEWELHGGHRRGLGVSALFTGPSGTGKTTAAEALAAELQLDLYRVDLSAVVSKYIGETEKNLRQVFDAAEDGGAVLFFDEADALFGKRSEVRDSHDRYANVEIAYLLQRMEEYRGLAILATNLRDSLDPAFLRRIRFLVEFPFPDTSTRAEIWRRTFPVAAPTVGLDVERLARLNVSGGSIRNIAVAAAFLAADAGGPIGMAEVLRAAQGECLKLGQPLGSLSLEGRV